VTEVRIWAANLPASVIKDGYRQPLTMLYEQKRAIKIKIKRRGDEESKKGAAPLRKPGGLKMASAFDKKIKPIVAPS
jgi:hypothetical protein